LVRAIDPEEELRLSVLVGPEGRTAPLETFDARPGASTPEE
jgi:hypothetical protein